MTDMDFLIYPNKMCDSLHYEFRFFVNPLIRIQLQFSYFSGDNMVLNYYIKFKHENVRTLLKLAKKYITHCNKIT